MSDVVVNTIKTLAIDAVQKANSGHPGMPMGMADTASVLWRDFLTVDPTAPDFVDRDRFVLSAGHGSMLQYALLHLAGFDLPLDEIKNFRQLGSKTPGHPEYGYTVGVETTTGPLGQGLGNAVGMAMAERYLAATFNTAELALVDHHTYVIAGDGCLHEGISHESASLAGHLGLGKLIVLFDDNGITIEGQTSLSGSNDVPARFEAYQWHVLKVDGHDHDAVRQAIEAAKAVTDRPSLIACRTHIGHGSPNKQDSEKSHGSPLGADEIRLTKEAIGWDPDAHFLVPDEARAGFDGLRERGAAKRRAWEEIWARYQTAEPERAAAWTAIHAPYSEELGKALAAAAPNLSDAGKQATRASSGKVLNALAKALPTLIGGSADLAGSNKTMLSGESSHSKENPAGRNLHFGIREHGMAAALNGMALHGGMIPYGGTFLTFTDYMRGAMRLSALMHQRVIYVLTHDSIFLGEDGPTHQAVEHAMALRVIPNMRTFRPADGNETAAAWLAAIANTKGPTSLLLTRQGLPQLVSPEQAQAGLAKGAYVISGAEHGDACDIVLLGSGSELHLCVEAAEQLASDGAKVRVVSVPSLELFLAQPKEVRDAVIPPGCTRRVSVEAGVTLGWQTVLGPFGVAIGIDRFGESAPAEVLAEHFGFTTDNVVKQARALLED